MIVAIQDKGHSFKGLHAYLSHDKRTPEEEAMGVKNTSKERVDFTACHNLCTDNIEFGWRVMAATAVNQNELKRDARARGEDVRITKETKPPVLHIAASWDRSFVEKYGEPNSDHYREALDGVLSSLGAEDHQAIAYAHNDTDNYHLHIMVNRVSPKNGRLLSDSNEQKNVQKWASKYCKKYELDVCPNRGVNAEIRKEYERAKAKASKVKDPQEREIAIQSAGEILDRLEGNKRMSHPEYEARKAGLEVANDRPETAKQIERNYAKRVKELSGRGTDMRERHKREFKGLGSDHAARKKKIYTKFGDTMKMVSRSIRSDYSDQIVATMKKLKADERRFMDREKTTSGRLFNALKTMVMDIGDKAISEPFTLIASSAARLDVLQADHEKQMKLARKEQDESIDKAMRELRSIRKQALEENLLQYRQEHQRARFRQKDEKAALSHDWKTLNVERKRKLEAQQPRREFKRNVARGKSRKLSRTRSRDK